MFPGTLVLVGIPPRFAGIVVHILVVSIAIYVLYLFAVQTLKITKPVALFLAMLCKENFFFSAIAFAIMALIWEIFEDQPNYRRLIPYSLISLVAALAAYFYIFSPPWFLEKTFNVTDRLPNSIYELLAVGVLKDKAREIPKSRQ